MVVAACALYRERVTTPDRTDPPSLAAAPWTFLLSATPWRSLLSVTLTAVLGLVLAAPVVATWFVAPFWGAVVARFERWHPVVLGLPPIRDPRSAGPSRRPGVRARLRDPLVWSESTFLVVFVAFAALSFALVVLVLLTAAVAVGAATGTRPPADDVIRSWLAGFHLGAPVLLAGSLVVFVLALYGVSAVAAVHVRVARALLSGRDEELEHRVEELTFSRRALLDGFDAERRRIERDLHDGAQQQLVALAMDVGLLDVELAAAERDGGDLHAVRSALERIGVRVDGAVGSLRASIRGIHPRVLVDHGLGAAVAELASRSPLPVRASVDLPVRPPARLETAAYFVVSEALTNAVKHAGAHSVSVAAGETDARFWLRVEDDGVGGARPVPGGGLDGLRERAVVLGGSLDVVSPAGGPTLLRFTAPLHDDERDAVPDVVRWRS